MSEKPFLKYAKYPKRCFQCRKKIERETFISYKNKVYCKKCGKLIKIELTMSIGDYIKSQVTV